MDPALRAAVADALSKVTDNSCKVCSTRLKFKDHVATDYGSLREL